MFTKLVRIGKDAELRHTSAGKAVIGLACVYDIGWGDNKKGQWLEVSIWGKQAEALSPYLLKGKQIVIYAEDVELDTFQKNDGSTGSKLKCRAINIDLTDNKSNDSQTQAAPQQAYQQQPQQNQPQQSSQQHRQQQPYNQNTTDEHGNYVQQQNQAAPQAQAQPMNNDFDSEINF
jgi:single-strand DNA-binding protein